MPRKSQKVRAQEAVLRIRALMRTDNDMKLAVATLLSNNKATGLGQLAIEHPKLVIALAESWVEMGDDPAYSGNPETGEVWR